MFIPSWIVIIVVISTPVLGYIGSLVLTLFSRAESYSIEYRSTFSIDDISHLRF